MRYLNQLPSPPTRGILGHVHYLKQGNVHRQMLEWKKQLGELYRLRVGIKQALVVTEPELIRQILKQRPQLFRRITNIESVFDEAGMNGVFSAEGENWRYQRRMIERAFSPANLKHFHTSMQHITESFYDRLDMLVITEEPVYIVDEFRRYTMDIITRLAFGEDVNAPDRTSSCLSRHLHNIFPVINQRCRSPFPLWRLIRSRQDRQFDADMAYIKSEMTKYTIRQRIRLKENTHLLTAPENILQVMLADQMQGKGLSDRDIIANAVTLFLAGEDTTANTLAWIVYLVGQRPEVEDRLINELNGSRQIYGTIPDWPLPKLPWLTAIMYEAMRLKPAAPQLYLEPVTDTTVGDVFIKKGTPVFLTLHAAGSDEQHFSQVEKFRPERWVEREGESFSALFPFGSGARICPGRALAMSEIKMALHALYCRYNVIPLQPAAAVEERFAFTLSPVNFKVMLAHR
ncbi:TPA: cytochrome P450 [Escherichia coli]|nr:cytochrome P450 [Escherichia coli]